MIYLFLADGFEEAEAICPLDLLRRAALNVKTVAVGGERLVRSTRNIRVEADMLIEDVKDDAPEAVILPGGMPGAENLRCSEEVKVLISACARSGGIVAAICAAPMVPGEMGLLRGRQAICYPGFEDRLTGAAIRKRAVVVDGKFVTAIGPGAAYEFGLTLVSLLKGKKEASAIQRAILPID